jgi:YidC/Oxa1 family membrane protein insertase
MYDLIARPLSWFYSLWPSYAGSITLLTLSIMVVLTPLTLKGTRSMLAMQRLQPDMKRLQAKYKDDRQKLNEEMLKFYKEHGINPVSGCLPLLLQMPVFFFLYRTLLGLTARAPYGSDMGSAVGRTAARAGSTYERFGVFFPKHLDKSSKLYQSLHSTREMRSWGLNLADSASAAVSKGVGHAAPFIVLVLFVAATSYIQQKQVAGRTPAASQVNSQQQMLLKLMPGFFALISLTLPAGIVLYFFVSNLYRIGQQAFITRTMYAEGGALATTATELEPAPKRSELAAPTAAPERRGLLAKLTATREGQASAPPPEPAKRSGAGADGRAQAPGAGATNGRATGSSRVTNPTKATKAVKPSNGAAPAAPAPSRSGAAPSRQRPPAPVNRSRAKKKRK